MGSDVSAWHNPRMRARFLAILHFYLALGIGWGHAMLLFTPQSLQAALNGSSVIWWTVGTLIGGVAAAAGIVMKISANRRRQLQGLSVEMVGIVALAGGPLQYMLIQIGFWFEGQFTDRYALAWFAYAMLAALLIRAASVVPEFFAEATDERKPG